MAYEARVTLPATSWQWRCNHVVLNRAKGNLQQLSDLTSSDGGLLLLREADRRLGLTRILASCVQDRRDPSRISHAVEEMMLFRMMAIACGHENADDCDALRDDPLFKLAAGRLPESGAPLCSQPTISRF